MICYYIFNEKPDAELIVDVQDQTGRSLGHVSGVALSPHPVDAGRWRLGPFYVPDVVTSEFSAGDVR